MSTAILCLAEYDYKQQVCPVAWAYQTETSICSWGRYCAGSWTKRLSTHLGFIGIALIATGLD